MKFNVDSRELAKAIGPVKEVATKNCVKEFDYCGFLTIKAKTHKLEIMAYGGTACLRTTISNAGTVNYSCKREGVVTVYAIDVFNALKTIGDGQVEVKSVSGEVIITLLSDISIKRTIEVFDIVVRPPNVGTKFEQSVVVNNRIFVKGLKSVMFAPAVKKNMEPYMCMLIETFTKGKDKTMRFTAGSGGRFAIKAISGKHIYETDEDVQIIFPKYNLPNIYKILSSVRCDAVSIKTVEQNYSKNIPEQIMIELDAGGVEIVLSIFGSDKFNKYPNMTNIINYQYPNRIYSDLKDWANAIDVVEMSRRGHASNIHNTKIIFELENERLMVTPLTQHANTIPISIVNVEGDANVVKGEKIWFKCNSDFLTEMTKRVKDGLIQLNFESQEILNTIPKDKPKQMKPILVKFHETEDSILNIRENFYMFFTVSTK